MTLNWKLGNEQGHNIPMGLPFGLRQLKQEVNDVPYLDHLLFLITADVIFRVRTTFCGEVD